MANAPWAEYRESMYGQATNTPTAVHESTLSWLEPVDLIPPSLQLSSPGIAGVVDLAPRADKLAREYDVPSVGLREVKWERMPRKWGDCRDGVIRIADHASRTPGWVLDSIIIHELGHLTHLDHGPEFQELIHRYPFTDQAHGYILAVQHREWSINRPPGK